MNNISETNNALRLYTSVMIDCDQNKGLAPITKLPIEQIINFTEREKSGYIFSDNLSVNKNITQIAAIEVMTEKRLLFSARLPNGMIEEKIFNKIM